MNKRQRKKRLKKAVQVMHLGLASFIPLDLLFPNAEYLKEIDRLHKRISESMQIPKELLEESTISIEMGEEARERYEEEYNRVTRKYISR